MFNLLGALCVASGLSVALAQEGATDGEAGLFSNTGAIFGIVVAALVLSLLSAYIIYRKTIPDDFLVERSRHYYASNRRSTLKNDEKSAEAAPHQRAAGSTDDFSPEAQASAGTYYSSPVQPNRGGAAPAAAGARAPKSPALVNVNAAAAPAPAPASQGMNYYKAGDAKAGAPGGAAAVRQRGHNNAAGAQTKKRFSTQAAPASGGGQTLIIDDED